MKINPDAIRRMIERLKQRNLEGRGKKGDKQAIRYYSNVLRAIPPWLTTEDYRQIKRIYRDAHAAGLVVDHIVPLKSELVCGLHVPWNLQATTNIENQKKGNSWWPNSPFEQGQLGL